MKQAPSDTTDLHISKVAPFWSRLQGTTPGDYRDLISEEATPFLGFAVDLMRRFMPKIRRTLTMATIWLLGQCTIFVRNREQLSNPPVSLDLDEAAVEWLSKPRQRVGIGWTSVRPNRCFFPH